MINVAINNKGYSILEEIVKFPPQGIEYEFINSIKNPFLEKPGGYYSTKDHDLIHAFEYFCFSENKLIFELCTAAELISFTLFGDYYNRETRIEIIKKILLKDNFQKLILNSNKGLTTLKGHSNITEKKILDKSIVVYPAIRRIEDSQLCNYKEKESITILFPGSSFFRKGGANVVDAFELLQRKYDNLKLILCAQLGSSNEHLKNEYLSKINKNPQISLKYLSREDLFKEYNLADIYLLPTYLDTFGFSNVEAMAFGLPIISTNYCAIPEMIQHGRSGFLIETHKFDYITKFKGYSINEIPSKFKEYMTKQLYDYLKQLIEDVSLRKKLGRNALKIARSKFSFNERNPKMKVIYEESMRR